MLCPFISCSDKLFLRSFYVPDLHAGMYNTQEYKVASKTQHSKLLVRRQEMLLPGSPTDIFAVRPVCSSGTGEVPVSGFI